MRPKNRRISGYRPIQKCRFGRTFPFSNYAYTPQEETFLIGALEGMKNVEGRDDYIALASLTREEDVAVFNRIQAQLMEAYL